MLAHQAIGLFKATPNQTERSFHAAVAPSTACPCCGSMDMQGQVLVMQCHRHTCSIRFCMPAAIMKEGALLGHPPQCARGKCQSKHHSTIKSIPSCARTQPVAAACTAHAWALHARAAGVAQCSAPRVASARLCDNKTMHGGCSRCGSRRRARPPVGPSAMPHCHAIADHAPVVISQRPRQSRRHAGSLPPATLAARRTRSCPALQQHP